MMRGIKKSWRQARFMLRKPIPICLQYGGKLKNMFGQYEERIRGAA